jgi:hypothetical protein
MNLPAYAEWRPAGFRGEMNGLEETSLAWNGDHQTHVLLRPLRPGGRAQNLN